MQDPNQNEPTDGGAPTPPQPPAAPRPPSPADSIPSHLTQPSVSIPQRPAPDEDFHAMEGEGFSNILSHLLKKPMSVVYELRHGQRSPLAALAMISLVCLAVFGFVLGMFSAGEQLWAAPVKVVGGLFFSALICLPSLYIFGCLSGMHASVTHFLGLILTLLAITSLLLVGFAPVVWLFSTSSNSLVFFGFLSLAIWLICLVFGLRVVSQAGQCLGGKRGGHLTIWACIFFLVTLQMTTTLRPIIGEPEDGAFINLKEKKFFLIHWGETMQEREAE